MKYGDVITLTSVASFNKDYSDVTHWYLYNDNATDTHGQKIVFNPELLIENYKNYSISWEFTEDCRLFKNNTGAEKFNMDLFGGENEPEYQFIVIFEKSVKEIEIELKFETNEVINKKIASISIDNNPERITWNEERGCYVAKINYSAETEHTIKLIGVETGYEFDSWQYGLGKLSSGDDDFSGVFEIPASIEEDNDTDIMKIYCVFKENADDFGGGLLWLWISLGGVAFVGALTIIIVAIRRRGGGVGNSGVNTKRYYY
ncbi:MAG: hypothetical protein J6T74_04495, partial [Clostridia bacterium]|nr:hypothetical protein [Clostridia bacterium]